MADKVLDAVLLMRGAGQELTLGIGDNSFFLIGMVVCSMSAVEPFNLRQPSILVEQMEESITEPTGTEKENGESDIDPPGY